MGHAVEMPGCELVRLARFGFTQKDLVGVPPGPSLSRSGQGPPELSDRRTQRSGLALVAPVALALAACGGSESIAVPTPSTGSVRITTSTTGENLDPDGYAVTVDGATPRAMGVSDTVTISQLSAGNHLITLNQVALNCAVGGLNPRTLGVSADDTTPSDFAVRCAKDGPVLPQTVYIWTGGTSSQNVMIASLAGIVNRNTSGELLLSPLGSRALPHPVFWLDQLLAAHPEVQTQSAGDPSFFIGRYKSMLSGYVLYDRAVNAHSINVATSIAGVTSAIIVDPATLSYAAAANLPLVADARSMTYSQVYAQYGSQFNRTMLFHHGTSFDETLKDYAVMNKGFVFYTDPTALSPFAANQVHQGRVYGWGTSEYDLFAQASQNNQQIVAGDWTWSSSTTARWNVPLAPQAYHPPTTIATEAGKHYVAFVMSDGDNVSSLTGAWATDPRWFGSPYRGTFDMSWDLSSTLAEVNPVAFNYYYQHASSGAHKDNFISAHGAGTLFPSQYPDNAGLVASISQSIKLADQRVISILDPSYDTTTLYPILADPQIIGMMFKTYDAGYRGRDGALDWHNGKPILSVKYSLWDGIQSAREIADALNVSPHRDGVHDPASYSIVNVHPWSTAGPTGTGSGNPMSNLHQLVLWLDSTKVSVVTIEELMVHLRKHFGTSP